jgi:hypothetical protein
LKISVENCGRVAAYKWRVVPRQLHKVDDDRVPDYIFVPAPGAPGRNANLRVDDTILPGCTEIEERLFSVRLRPIERSREAILNDAMLMLQTLEITFQVPTETSPGALTKLAIGEHIDFDQVPRVLVQWIAI